VLLITMALKFLKSHVSGVSTRRRFLDWRSDLLATSFPQCKGDRMKHLDLNSTIGNRISARPHSYHVFASLRLDCSEGRSKPLQLECWERRLAPLEVLARLHGNVKHDQHNGEYVARSV
jgi:hypothetical protein